MTTMPEEVRLDRIPPTVARVLLSPKATQGELGDLMAEVYGALRADGIPAERGSWSVPMLHPALRSYQLIWRSGEPVRRLQRGWNDATAAMYARSPIRPLYEGTAHVIRHRIRPDDAPRPYDILDELAAEGFTDYLAMATPAPVGWDRAPVTLSTTAPGGFSDAHLEALTHLMPLLTLVLRVHAQRGQTRALLETYLGEDAASRVLDGHIRRGDVVEIEAAVCFCDLRNFTALSQQLPQEDLLGLLDDAFGAVVGSVEAERGDVLKFIGDAVLAVFRAGEDEASRRDAAARATRAARNALTRAREIDAQRRTDGKAPLSIGLSIHLGRVSYGNIGGPMRLDFTVIGAAVNLASRLEGMCRTLGYPIVLSEAVASRVDADALGDATLEDAGTHLLKGIPEPVRVYGIRLPDGVPEGA
jgi:adenylate cyclase